MKIAFFQALVAGLLLLVAPVINTPTSAQVYQTQTYQTPTYQTQVNQGQVSQGQMDPGQSLHPRFGNQTGSVEANPQFSLSQNNYGNNFQNNNYQNGNYQNSGYQQPRIPRYPLSQMNNLTAGTSPQGYAPASVYPRVDRNAIQQPQLYPNNGVGPGQTQPAPRVFSPGSYSGANQQYVPQMANNYGYQNQVRELPGSPSNLPIPGGNVNPGNVESLNQIPGIQQNQEIAPTVQPTIPGQQGVPQTMPMQPQPQQQLGGPAANPYAGNAHGFQPQPGMNNMGPAYGAGCGNGCGYNAGFGRGLGGGCRILAPARCCNPGVWFGSLGGLVFRRDYEDDHVYAYPAGFPLTNSLVTTQANTGSIGGLEASFGRRFCNGAGFEVVYWGLFPDDGVATASGGNPQTQWATADRIDYNVSTMDVYLNAALAYRLRRTNEFHNIELNFFRQTSCGDSCCGGGGFGLGAGLAGRGWGRGAFGANCGAGGCGVGGCGTCGTGCGPCCRPLRARRPYRFDVLAGIRFFRFDENLFFQASTLGDYSPNINDMHYDIDVTNNLVGFQVGGNIEYCLTRRWTMVGGTRFGIYANSISQTQQIYGLAGYAVPNAGPWAGQDFNQRSTKEDVAFLGQLDLGLRYAINCRWGLGFGYRVVSVSGVALAPNQIPYDFSDYQEVNYINSNGSLILHGAYARVQYNY